MNTNGTGQQNLQKTDVLQYINVKLAALGQPTNTHTSNSSFLELARPLLTSLKEKDRLLANRLSPVDQRIQNFLNAYLDGNAPRLPANTFILDRPGLARILSLPPDRDQFSSPFVTSYRVKQGVLHNPRNDRRTTKGVFHVTEEGFPIPDDKIAVPKKTFSKLLEAALSPPPDTMVLPFTSNQDKKAALFVTLLIRPLVCPAVEGFTNDMTMETRFFVPGSLVSNLDFVESIFGNAGDPYLPENDAGLDVEHWTGHTGCVILAPHLSTFKKKDLGLPHRDQATERQKRDDMCWNSPDEPYNGGEAFKITCRDERGVMVTIIADNYFGYCKKEVKTQISYAANLYGLAEEEHSGGAVAYPSYILGREFYASENVAQTTQKIDDVIRLLGNAIEVRPQGFAVDRAYPTIFYVPEDSWFNINHRSITWKKDGQSQTIKLLADHFYVLPSGYKVRMERQIGGRNWRLIGTTAEGTFCHKPSTVSGGGKSEISKSIVYSMLQGPVFVKDFHKDCDQVEEILKRDYSGIFKTPPKSKKSLPILSPKRSLGSVIKLFTPSGDYTDAYNEWLVSLPQTIRQLVFVVKRYYKPDWKDDWRQHFGVDRINGLLGHELKHGDQHLVANYLRMGHETDGSWRTFKLRTDFNPADKVQVEDDITASVVVPRDILHDLNPATANLSVKIAKNCETMLFQRPDDAIYRGYDKQAEADVATPNTFLSNFEPLTRKEAQDIVEDVIDFEHYSPPMRELLRSFLEDNTPGYVASSAHPRLVDGKPTKNPRYLQKRPDIVNARGTYLAKVGKRLSRSLPSHQPIQFSVDAVLAGRRNNPQDRKNGIPPLAVYGPIHYQEYPELFMDFISSLTGKSPSTTGFGSEGALTKGPFNALWPIVDLNNALVSYILTGYPGFTTSAGIIGPHIRVDHDISLLVPEIWCRLKPLERDPDYLLKTGYLEKVRDFEHKGKKIQASLLGYRITSRFVDRILGRIFEFPNLVFTEEILRPEVQDVDLYAEGIENIVATYQRVAENYFQDGSIDAACPPLKAILHIMAKGSYQGKRLNHPDVRSMFKRESLLSSDWYKERLEVKRTRDVELWVRHLKYLEQARASFADGKAPHHLKIQEKLRLARKHLKHVKSPEYLKRLQGSIGADPFHLQIQSVKRPLDLVAHA